MKVRRPGEQGIAHQDTIHSGDNPVRARTGLDRFNPFAPSKTKEDKVNVSGVGALLHDQLNPEKIQTERREKIEQIKAALKAGNYNPPVEQVAEAISNEISLEILTQGGLGSDEA